MRFKAVARQRALTTCALLALTSCSTDEEPGTEAGLGPTMSPVVAGPSAYDIVKVPAMTVDGNLDDWANIAFISMEDNSGRESGLDNTAKVKLAWDDTYLYAAYDVTDSELLAEQTTYDHPDTYKDDAVELYIDPQGDGSSATHMTPTDYHILANVRDALGDFRGSTEGPQDRTYNAASFLAKAVTSGTLNASGTDAGYQVELRISWSDLGVTPSAGAAMRMDLAVGDDDTPNTQTEEFDWAGLTTFNNPSGWKDVQLVNPDLVSDYDVVRVASMAVDGNLDDWAGIASISMADASGRSGGVDNTAQVKLAWDPTYLYYAFDVTDTELLAEQTERDNGAIYKDDEVELYIDPERGSWTRSHMSATDYQFLANVRDALGDLKGNGSGGKDASFNAGSFLAKAALTGSLNGGSADTGYRIEGRIAWSDLEVTPAAGHFMRVDLAVGDRDAPATNTEEFDWAGLSTFNNPAAWKDVRLVVDATAPAAPTNLTLTAVSSSQIDVSWTHSTSSDVAHYKIYRATSGTPTPYQTVAGSPYHDTGLTSGTSYSYQVSAVDAAGNESQKTATESATPGGGGTASGRPYGPMNSWASSINPHPHTEFFSLITGADSPSGIVARIQAARDRGVKMVLFLTGGSHSNYITGGAFDPDKWKAVLDQYNTSQIRQAIDSGVADGTILGYSMIDEPPHSSWGGYFTKPRIEQLYDYARAIFPTLPLGVVLRYDWRTHETFTRLDFTVNQYWKPSSISVTQYRDEALAQTARDGVVPIFSLNVLAGGFRGGDYSTCPVGEFLTGGYYKYPDNATPPRCRMTPRQIVDFGQTLGAAGRGLLMWQWDLDMFEQSSSGSFGISYQEAFSQVRAYMDQQQGGSWRRGS